MVTVSLEEPALAPVRTFVRVPYLEHLELVERSCKEADFLFVSARLALLPDALADCRPW